MATNKKLLELPTIAIPSTGTNLYMVERGQSYQGVTHLLAQLIINNYGLITSGLNAAFMTTGNAELILNGLNNAVSSKLDPNRINMDFSQFISGYWDVDGGTFYDKYVNVSNFDGGGI